MKKLVILPAAFLFAGIVAKAQDNSFGIDKANTDKNEAKKEMHQSGGDEVGILVRDHFYADFGDQDVTWRRTRSYDEATFMQNGKQLSAYYDADASLIGTVAPATFTELPAGAQKEIQKQYKGYDIGSVILFDDNEYNSSDMMFYGSTAADEDNYFVELKKNDRMVILQVNMEGEVSFFTQRKI